MIYTGKIYTGIHPYLKSLVEKNPRVIIPDFPELTQAQARNPAFFDIHDYTDEMIESLSLTDRRELFDRSPSVWVKDNCKILDKRSTIVPFEWNKEQWIMFFVLREFWRRGMPVRIIILKGRQFGSTTFWTSIFYWIMNKRKNTNGLMLAHNKETSKIILEMIHRYQTFNPVKYKATSEARTHIKLSGINSSIRVGTGHGRSEGVGTTCNILLGEEVARWSDGGELVGAMFQAIPRLPHTMIILNSTARGYGNYFHNVWRDSKNETCEFKGIFLPWDIHEEYTHDFLSKEDELNFCLTLDSKERKMKEMYNLTNGQLRWRRAKIAEQAGGANSEDLFCENYPLTDTEAFLANSSNYFDNIALHNRLTELTAKYSVKKPLRGSMRGQDNRWTFFEDKSGRVEIYELPKKGTRYVVSGDISLGVTDGDYTSIDVIDIQTFTQVATCHGKMDEEAQIALMKALGWFYNRAIVVPESNFNPYVARKLAQEYSKTYRRRRANGDEAYGWRTDATSRMQMLARLRWLVSTNLIGLNCQDTIEEMMAFGFDGVKVQAQKGMHDDRVMSLAIGVEVAYENFSLGPMEPSKMRGNEPKRSSY